MKEMFQVLGIIIGAALLFSILRIGVSYYYDIQYKNEMIELQKEKLRLEIEIKKKQLDL